MVTYEVVLEVEAPLAAALEDYMRRRHIPEILATGCFRRIAFERAGPTRFRTRYEAESQADLDRYLAEHTPRLRADFLAHFPTGVRVSREVWAEVERWESGGG